MNRLQGLGRYFTKRPATEPTVPLQAANLTRGTILAVRLETAHTGATRRKGLLGRDGLLPGEGLWIAPCESVHTFFMRFTIDLVYLDRKKKVRKVRSRVGPWRLSACLTASSVLELPAGTIEATRTERGDRVEIGPCREGTGNS
jgi:hypothetical protein